MVQELISKHICMSKDIGIQGNLFGGIMLSWLDAAGAIYASELCEDTHVVTVHMDNVTFKKPVKQGNIIYIYGRLEKFGKTSVTINLNAVRKNIDTDKECLVCETKMVFVSIDSESSPREIQSSRKKEYLKTIK
jgi:acyl-CoA thioesterase YciA